MSEIKYTESLMQPRVGFTNVGYPNVVYAAPSCFDNSIPMVAQIPETTTYPLNAPGTGYIDTGTLDYQCRIGDQVYVKKVYIWGYITINKAANDGFKVPVRMVVLQDKRQFDPQYTYRSFFPSPSWPSAQSSMRPYDVDIMKEKRFKVLYDKVRYLNTENNQWIKFKVKVRNYPLSFRPGVDSKSPRRNGIYAYIVADDGTYNVSPDSKSTNIKYTINWRMYYKDL